MSGVSLPTIQNIERGVANPSFSTLQSLLDALGLRLNVEGEPVDWDTLVSCGLPLLQNETTAVRPSRPLLIQSLRRALCELHEYYQEKGRQDYRDCSQQAGEYERKRDSVCALLLALKTHYGSVFDKNFARLRGAQELLGNNPTGRILKLRRIALSRLAEYL